MSEMRRLLTRVETRDWTRDSQHQNVGQYSCVRAGRERRSLERNVNRESDRQYLLVEPGVRSAVENRNLDHLQAVVGVEEG